MSQNSSTPKDGDLWHLQRPPPSSRASTGKCPWPGVVLLGDLMGISGDIWGYLGISGDT